METRYRVSRATNCVIIGRHGVADSPFIGDGKTKSERLSECDELIWIWRRSGLTKGDAFLIGGSGPVYRACGPPDGPWLISVCIDQGWLWCKAWMELPR